MVLTDPMVDPRGGALTLGLGLVDSVTVVPHFGDEHDDAHGQKLERTVAMAPAGLPVVALPARTALIRSRRWRLELCRCAASPSSSWVGLRPKASQL